jgi:hypothetical protein
MHDCSRTLVPAEYGYPEGSPSTNSKQEFEVSTAVTMKNGPHGVTTQKTPFFSKQEIRHYSSQYSARHIVHPSDLVMNLMAQLDNWR